MPKIDPSVLKPVNSTTYPAPFDTQVSGRWQQRLGQAAGFTHLGANLVTLKPGAWSSQRHWHRDEDEFLVMLGGEAVLAEDEGETVLRAGDLVAWAANAENGHHLINRSDADCTFICFSAGNRGAGGAYSDIDMIFGAKGYFHKDGTPYSPRE